MECRSTRFRLIWQVQKATTGPTLHNLAVIFHMLYKPTKSTTGHPLRLCVWFWRRLRFRTWGCLSKDEKAQKHQCYLIKHFDRKVNMISAFIVRELHYLLIYETIFKDRMLKQICQVKKNISKIELKPGQQIHLFCSSDTERSLSP